MIWLLLESYILCAYVGNTILLHKMNTFYSEHNVQAAILVQSRIVHISDQCSQLHCKIKIYSELYMMMFIMCIIIKEIKFQLGTYSQILATHKAIYYNKRNPNLWNSVLLGCRIYLNTTMIALSMQSVFSGWLSEIWAPYPYESLTLWVAA